MSDDFRAGAKETRMHGALNYLLTKEHIADLRRATERPQFTRREGFLVGVMAQLRRHRRISDRAPARLDRRNRARRASDAPAARQSARDAAPIRPSESVLLGDGAEIRIRALTSKDRAAVAALFTRLSAESRYRRFFTSKHELTERELVFLTDVDHVRHEALAAVDQRDSSILGVARYVQCSKRPRVAAVAFEVADQWQRRGIGMALAERLLERARINDLDCLSATTLWENVPARALLRRLGFRAHASESGTIDLVLALKPSSQRGQLVGHAHGVGCR